MEGKSGDGQYASHRRPALSLPATGPESNQTIARKRSDPPTSQWYVKPDDPHESDQKRLLTFFFQPPEQNQIRQSFFLFLSNPTNKIIAAN